MKIDKKALGISAIIWLNLVSIGILSYMFKVYWGFDPLSLSIFDSILTTGLADCILIPIGMGLHRFWLWMKDKDEEIQEEYREKMKEYLQ